MYSQSEMREAELEKELEEAHEEISGLSSELEKALQQLEYLETGVKQDLEDENGLQVTSTEDNEGDVDSTAYSSK